MRTRVRVSYNRYKLAGETNDLVDRSATTTAASYYHCFREPSPPYGAPSRPCDTCKRKRQVCARKVVSPVAFHRPETIFVFIRRTPCTKVKYTISNRTEKLLLRTLLCLGTI